MLLQGEGVKKEIELDAVRNNFSSFMDFIESHLADTGLDKKETIKIMTASEEALVNIITYAYTGLHGKLKVEFQTRPGSINITFIDGGMAFNPLQKKDADVSLPLEERKSGGLGILMIKKLVDDVKYEYKENKNHLTITKFIS